jgi:16S rRNA (guanine966-N2)-methyltransferase
MNSRRGKPSRSDDRRLPPRTADETTLRIVGGEFRGRKLLYSGDLRTRPMKDRVREALFNLIGPDVKGTHAIDLFAGTGALGLEAVSRGAAGATLIERHFPTADLIRRNVEGLEAENRCQVQATNAFTWLRRSIPPADVRWLVLCSPPFEFYTSQREEMDRLIAELVEQSPVGSIVAVETPEAYDVSTLPHSQRWQTRQYPPVILAIYRK